MAEDRRGSTGGAIEHTLVSGRTGTNQSSRLQLTNNHKLVSVVRITLTPQAQTEMSRIRFAQIDKVR